VSLQASAGHTIGLVGESGCGKTTLSRAMVGLLAVSSGQVTVEGHAWRSADREQTARMRRAVQLVFQDPYASLNPRWRVRQIVAEGMNGERRDSGELMELVGLPRAFLDRYPDELSGGQRQRVGIARALAAGPDLLIADEPVSALDVSVQAQVINLLGDLRDRLGLGLVFVAHDLAVVRHVSDELAVMYRGRIIEQGPAEEVFDAPLHPYTRRLIASAPGQGGPARSPGNLVDGTEVPATGCRFRDQCPIGPLADPGRIICEEQDPLLPATGGHRAACHFPGEAAPGHAGEAAPGPEPAP
jgi:peptide/nickel transport system ATP-binding protein